MNPITPLTSSDIKKIALIRFTGRQVMLEYVRIYSVSEGVLKLGP
jgi:hypothetical protein